MRYLLLTFILLTSCATLEESEEERMRRFNQKAEYLYRRQNDSAYATKEPALVPPKPYPWEVGRSGKYPRITKEFFRCKGSLLNPVQVICNANKEPARYFDCGGAERHSLILRDNKEFIYPILLELMNEIQDKTGKRVVITSGHRCPEHNTYVDPSPANNASKHMIGAEVSFYVQGMEERGEAIVKLLMDHYKGEVFERYTKGDADVTTPPWLNKEIWIKLYKKKEGRNLDNRHPYPYISLSVRYDIEKKERVAYSWDKAFHGFLRH